MHSPFPRPCNPQLMLKNLQAFESMMPTRKEINLEKETSKWQLLPKPPSEAVFAGRDSVPCFVFEEIPP